MSEALKMIEEMKVSLAEVRSQLERIEERLTAVEARPVPGYVAVSPSGEVLSHGKSPRAAGEAAKAGGHEAFGIREA